LHRVEEWTLLLDDAVDRNAANFDCGGQDRPPSLNNSGVQPASLEGADSAMSERLISEWKHVSDVSGGMVVRPARAVGATSWVRS
jgi:hypothetical protein